MTTIVEVDGGVAEVTEGHAIVIDWDNIREDQEAGYDALCSLYRKRGPAARKVRADILVLWPDLRRMGR